MATAVGDLVVRLGAQTRGFDSRMRRSTGVVRVMTGAVYGLGSAIMTALAPIAGVYGLIKLTTAGERFNQKMRQSLAIMGDVSDAMRKDMRRAAFETAKVTVFSASEAGEAFYFLATAGLTAAQSIKALPAVSQFAQAGMFDLARATELATDAQHALGMSATDPTQNLRNLTRVTDTLVRANTLADATTEQFAEALTQKAGAAFKIVGKDVEEVVAVLAALAMAGRKGEEAGTQLSRVMIGLKSNAINNAAAFRRLRVTVFDENEEMRNLADIVEDLEGSIGRMTDKQQQASIEALGFTKRNADLVALLIGMSGKIRTFEGELRKAGGTAKEVADKQLTPLQRGWAKLGATMTQVGADILQTIGPALETALTAVSNYVTGAWETIKFGVQNAGDLSKLALVELALKVLQLVPQVESPLEKVAEVFAGVFSGIGAFARTIIDNIIGSFKELMNVARAVGAAIKEGFRAIAEGDIRNAAGRMADTFIDAFAKQQNVQAPNAFKEFQKAYNEAAGKVRGKFARSGGAKAALEAEQQRLLMAIAGREAKGRVALDLAAGAGPAAAVAATGAGAGAGVGGKMYAGAAERGTAEAWTRTLRALGGGKKNPIERINKEILGENKKQTAALERIEDGGGEGMEIPG